MGFRCSMSQPLSLLIWSPSIKGHAATFAKAKSVAHRDRPLAFDYPPHRNVLSNILETQIINSATLVVDAPRFSKPAFIVPLLAVLISCGVASADDQEIYSYTNKKGITVYVNDADLLPPSVQPKAKVVDLSHISLNTPLGKDLTSVINAEYSKIMQSGECYEARANSGSWVWVERAWSQHPHWILLAMGALVLLIATPFIIRHGDVARWARTLKWLVPLLAAVGILATVGIKTRQQRGRLATLCTSKSTKTSSPKAQTSHKLDIVRRYRAIHAARINTLDKELRRQTR